MRVGAKPIRHGKSRERGSTLVEFTLTILPLLGLLMLTVDTAWVLFARASIQEAVREGVRFAITCQSDASIRSQVQKYSFGFVTAQNVASVVKIQYSSPASPLTPIVCGGKCAGDVVTITVSGVSISPMAPIWRSSSPLNLAASSSDIVEANPNCQ